jgi:hypothetical protein
MFNKIAGGFVLKPEDEVILNVQRAITKQINESFIQVGAIFLKTSSKNPYDSDWFNRNFRDTNLQEWIDDPEAQLYNVGFNLQLGWVDIDIDADDPEYNECIVAALSVCGIDTRFKFGRLSAGRATHVMVQLNEDEATNYDFLKKFEPNEFVLGKKRFKTQIRSYSMNTNKANVAKEAKQTVMPGSVYVHKTQDNIYDMSVWYSSKGGVAKMVSEVAATTPRRATFNYIIRAIAFGTMLYIVRPHWVSGSRQIVAQKVAGWLARVVREGQALNNHEGVADDVFCPIDSDGIAESLLGFICDQCGDDEKHMRIRTYGDACDKIERNPDAKIPGWPSIEQLFGGEAVAALRTVFMPGSDVSVLTKLAERYVYDESDNKYIDRTRFFTSGGFVHEGSDLERRHKGDKIRIAGKPKEAFKIYESSDMRRRIGARDLYPDYPAGGIYRISSLGQILSDDDDSDRTALTTFNTWRGWPIARAATVDTGLLTKCVIYIDQLLGYLSRDNVHQVEWWKKWFAWIIQHPGMKQQIAPVIVGGQGVGKSFLGNVFVKALLRSLWGTASPKLLEGQFSVEPFIDKMVVFIDEARFHGDASTDEIKKLIRNVEMGGAEKYQSARTYRIFSRVMFASNRFDMNIGQANVQDRALFYMKAYDRDFLRMSAVEFRRWAEGLKPWFDEFMGMLEHKTVLEHYMHYFLELPVSRHEVESVEHSSSLDPDIVSSNMSWARRVAKYIIEDGRIHEDLDISFPFAMTDLNRRVVEICKELGMQPINGQRVLAEFQEADLIETYAEKGRNHFRFTHRIGTITEVFGDTISVKLEPRFEFAPDDYGKNTCTLEDRPLWRGANSRLMQKF